ncbi:alpha/beta hydrolase family protein [Salipiger mucosus]|uniref:alpha/beta hydrolase family protein n=1 Tax=Salipiger mucosus TaxID=263378 RepID=UPI00036583E2|nr:alpha/beta fold hydrolase [Salipiger mucosus]
MKRRWIVWVTLGLIATVASLAGALVAFSRIADFEIPAVPATDIGFEHDGATLQGTLLAASEIGPILLIVHGDGAQDRWSDTGYLPLINALVGAGVSVFSWDKPGVGASSGNWLSQSMHDRAAEAAEALAAIRAQPGNENRPIGLLGFSQAGWVLPRVPSLTEQADFLVLIGAAINWQDQGRYFTTVQLSREGRSLEEIAAELDRQAKSDQRRFGPGATYRDYVAAERAAGRPEGEILTKDRFGFIRLNHGEDAREHIARLTLPMLVLMGADDLNVDPLETVSVYQELIGMAHPQNRIHLVPGATHSLLDARYYNYQLPDQWPFAAKVRFALAGRDAYSRDVINIIAGWIDETAVITQ